MTTDTAPGDTLRVLVVDDEPLARLRLRGLLEAEPGVTVVGEAADAAQAQAWLANADTDAATGGAAVDALLLDIRMPGLDGMRLAALLQRQVQPPAVIFVTAHAEHALRAFELEALDYLTKPVRRERLQAALLRLRQRQRLLRAAASGAPAAGDGPVLVVSDRGRVLRLPLAEVLYLKAGAKQVTLYTPGLALVLDESLSELEQRLQDLVTAGAPGGAGYIRIHRNALVAVAAIRALELRELRELAELTEPTADGDAGEDASGKGDRGDGASSDSRGGGGGGGGVGGGSDSSGSTNEAWAVRVAPRDEWLRVSRRQVSAVRAAMHGTAGDG